MNLSKTSLFFSLLIAVFFSKDALAAPVALAAAEKASVYVDADQYVSKPGQSAELTGHVKVIRGVEQLTCDHANINLLTSEVIAQGNVIFISPAEYIRAEKMTYNFNTKKGLVNNGFIQMGQQTIEGEEIYKTAEEEFKASSATYTSCVNCPPSWKLSGSHIDATAGKYAYIKNPVVRVYGAPILWLPYIVIPIKNQRQSGLLAPFVEFRANDDRAFGVPFFWAIDKSKDMTLTETWYKLRGYKTGVEYRYVTDKNSGGKFYGNFINDSFYSKDKKYLEPDKRYWTLTTPRETESAIPRYSLHYEQHLELPDNFTNNISLNYVRDAHHVLDYPKDIRGYAESALENRVSLAKETENTHTSVDVDVYENLIKADPVGGNNDAIHRVPELRFSAMPKRVFGSGLLADLNLSYLNLAGGTKTYDDTHGGPSYTNRSYFRSGQRFIATPELSYPFVVAGFFDIVPQVSYSEHVYQFGYSQYPVASRRYLRTSIEGKTRFSGIYGDELNPKATRYKHAMEPDIGYTQVPLLYQETHPFFGKQEIQSNFRSDQAITEFDAIQFDYRDRLLDRDLITVGFTNKLIRKRFDGSKSNYEEIVRYRLSQSYDVYNTYQPDPISDDPNQIYKVKREPWGDIRSELAVRLDHLTLGSDVSYYPYQNLASNSSSVGVRDLSGNGISVGFVERYSYLRDPATTLPTKRVDTATRSEAGTLTLYISSKYLDIAGTTSFNIIQGWQPSSQSFAGIIKPPGKCWGLQFTYEKIFGTEIQNWTFNLPIFFGDGKDNTTLDRPSGV